MHPNNKSFHHKTILNYAITVAQGLNESTIKIDSITLNNALERLQNIYNTKE